MNNKNDQMHPDDLRNMFIFFLASITIYMLYNTFVLEPKNEAIEAARVQQAAFEQTPEYQESIVRPQSRGDVISSVERIKIDNGQISGSISLKGARLDDIALNQYYETLDKKKNVALLSPKRTTFPRYIDYGWVSKNKAIAVPDANTNWSVIGNQKLTKDSPVILSWDNGAGIRFERKITLDDRYVFQITQRVINNSGTEITLFPFGLISQKGVPIDFEGRFILHEGPIGFVGEELIERSYKKLIKEGPYSGEAIKGWVGVTDKYWLTTLMPAQGQAVKYRYHYIPSKTALTDEKEQGRFQVDYLGAEISIAPGNTGSTSSHLFVGAKELNILTGYQKDLGIPRFDLAVDFGWFWFMTKPFFSILHFFGTTIGNFGVAILLLTFFLRMSVYPLTSTSYRSFAKMKKVAPETAKLREKHGKDRTALQQDLMQLYQREGVNPMAGCFPILVQIPIFFAFYKVLFGTIEVRHAPFFGWIQDLSAPDPTSIFNLFGLIPYDVPSFLQIGVWPCVMLVAMLLQKQLNPPPQDPIQRDMMNYFPFIITFVMAKFASGLVIYWAFSAILSIMQQAYIMHSLGVPIHLFGQTEEEEKAEKAMEEGPAVHPLVEMVEDEVEEAMFGDDDEPIKPITPPKHKKKKKKK